MSFSPFSGQVVPVLGVDVGDAPLVPEHPHGGAQARHVHGALDHPAEYAYYARVPSGEDETLVHCRHNRDELAPTACRQVFGSFVVSPTTR